MRNIQGLLIRSSGRSTPFWIWQTTATLRLATIPVVAYSEVIRDHWVRPLWRCLPFTPNYYKEDDDEILRMMMACLAICKIARNSKKRYALSPREHSESLRQARRAGIWKGKLADIGLYLDKVEGESEHLEWEICLEWIIPCVEEYGVGGALGETRRIYPAPRVTHATGTSIRRAYVTTCGVCATGNVVLGWMRRPFGLLQPRGDGLRSGLRRRCGETQDSESPCR